MSAQVLSTIAGVVLSLLFSYFPGLNTWFAKKEPGEKRLLMLGLIILVAVAAFGIGCWGIVQTGVTCDQDGAIALVMAVISAAIANQTTYNLTPQTKAVKMAKAERPL